MRKLLFIALLLPVIRADAPVKQTLIPFNALEKLGFASILKQVQEVRAGFCQERHIPADQCGAITADGVYLIEKDEK